MFKISKEYHFSAAHHLTGLPREHQCSRLHGHNYLVVVQLESEALDHTGFVLDYGELKPVKQFIDNELDHRDLNDVLPKIGGPYQPSAEHMARWLARKVRELISVPDGVAVAVGVSETPSSWAWFKEDQGASERL